MIVIEISRKNVENNINIIKKINKNIMWVLKDNAYGIGITEIYSILDKLDEKIIGVSTFFEADIIRKYEKSNNLVESNIYLLNKLDSQYISNAFEYNLYITITSFEQLNEYIEILKSNNKDLSKLKINIKVNSGMNRLGFKIDDSLELINIIKSNNIELESIYSHIGNYLDENFVESQAKYLEEFSNIFKKHKLDHKLHLQASPTLFKYEKKYNYDLARVGMSLYGLNPLPEIDFKTNLQNILKVKTNILEIRNIKKGDLLGYDNIPLDSDKKIAIVQYGYSNGMYKKYNKNGVVSINNKLYNIVSDICMDMIFVDLENDDISIEDEVYIINEQIPPSLVAKFSNTIADDVICKLPTFNTIRKIIE